MASIKSKDCSTFKVRLRKAPIKSEQATTTLNEDAAVGQSMCHDEPNKRITTNHLSTLSILSDPILTDIAHQLNIPNNILATPKRNFGTTSKTYGSSIVEFESSVIDSTHDNSSIYNQSDNTSNVNINSKTYEFERLEARRRLELMKQKADLINKFTQVKLTAPIDEEDDNDDTSSISSQKIIRTFSADDSVVEVTKDTFEPKFVKDINFEVLKDPNSQQKISMKNENSIESFKKPIIKSSSSKKKKLRVIPSKESLMKKHQTNTANKRLLPLNLDSKLAAVADDEPIGDIKPPIDENSLLPKISSHSKSKSSDSLNKKSSISSVAGKSLSVGSLNEESLEEIPSQSSDAHFEKLKKITKSLGSKYMKQNQVNEISKSLSSSKKGSTSKSSDGLNIKTIYVNKKPYVILNNIGKGGSSIVYQVYSPETQQTLALKKVNLKNAEKSVVEGFRTEIKVLQKLRNCSRVVKMYDYEFRNNNEELLIVMEKGDADLSNVLKTHFESNQSTKHFSPHLIKLYWQEMLEAVKEIHENNIVHSDLKPVNFILVSGKLKLIDFGIANTIKSNQTNVYKDTIIGTVDYMAPESLTKRREHANKVKYNQKVDIWSLGIILYNLVYGVTPFAHHGSDMIKKAMAIINCDIEYDQINDSLLMDVIKKCLQKDPKKRPTAVELLCHPYLKESASSENTVAESSQSDKSPVPSKIPDELLSQISNLTPDTLKTFTKFVQAFSQK